MTDITPPPELVQQWRKSGPADAAVNNAYERHIATCAAQWGADTELEAIQKEIITQAWFADPRHRLAQLRAARRPKPPSLKKQALEMLENAWEGGHINNNAAQTIRRALEQLDD